MHVSSWSRGAVALGCTGAARGVAWHGRESPVAQCVLLADSRAWVCALPTDVPWRSPMAPGQLLGLGVDLREADAWRCLPRRELRHRGLRLLAVYHDARRVVGEMNRVLRSRGLLLADRIPGSA
jgi:hypothetical protein